MTRSCAIVKDLREDFPLGITKPLISNNETLLSRKGSKMQRAIDV